MHTMMAVGGGGIDVLKEREPGGGCNDKVQEAFHHVERGDGIAVVLQIVSDFLGGSLWSLLRHLEEWKHHQCEVTLKLAACLLQLYQLFRNILSVECLYGSLCCQLYLLFYLHTFRICVQRYE